MRPSNIIAVVMMMALLKWQTQAWLLVLSAAKVDCTKGRVIRKMGQKELKLSQGQQWVGKWSSVGISHEWKKIEQPRTMQDWTIRQNSVKGQRECRCASRKLNVKSVKISLMASKNVFRVRTEGNEQKLPRQNQPLPPWNLKRAIENRIWYFGIESLCGKILGTLQI